MMIQLLAHTDIIVLYRNGYRTSHKVQPLSNEDSSKKYDPVPMLAKVYEDFKLSELIFILVFNTTPNNTYILRLIYI